MPRRHRNGMLGRHQLIALFVAERIAQRNSRADGSMCRLPRRHERSAGGFEGTPLAIYNWMRIGTN